jgi:hypothetical protein
MSALSPTDYPFPIPLFRSGGYLAKNAEKCRLHFLPSPQEGLAQQRTQAEEQQGEASPN